MVKRKLSTKPSNTDGLERSAKRVRSDPAPPSNPEPLCALCVVSITEIFLDESHLAELSRRKTSSTKRKAKDSAPSGPAPERTSSLWKVGAHVSAAGGVDNAIKNAAAIGYGSYDSRFHCTQGQFAERIPLHYLSNHNESGARLRSMTLLYRLSKPVWKNTDINRNISCPMVAISSTSGILISQSFHIASNA